MRFDKIITLVSLTYAKDALRQEIETPVERDVYANEFAIGASEFYAAGEAGLRPDRQFQIRAEEYADEPQFRSDGVLYQIVRADRRGQWVRLSGQRKVANLTAAVS